MGRHVEPLGGGLVTTRDPVALAVGELSQMQNAVYLPGDMAAHRAVGRDAFGTVSATATPVRGLRDLKFDSGDQFLIAMASSTLSSALVGDTGTFASVTNFTASGTALDAVQFNDAWYLFGGSENLVMYTSATSAGQSLNVRSHGLAPNTIQVSAATGAGTWTAGSTGYFEYWMTEVLEYTQNGVTSRLESTFTGTPFTLFVSSTALQATVTLPAAPLNSGATKWILYRGGPKALATDKTFPTGFKLAEGTFGTATAVLDGSATTGSQVLANATASNGGAAAFSNPTNVFAADNTFATKTGTLSTGTLTVSFPTFTIVEPVVGITLQVEGKSTSGPSLVFVSVSSDGGNSFSTPKNVPLVNANTPFSLGGPTDLWGLNWSAASLVAGQFQVRVTGTPLLSSTISIDDIAAKITSAGSKQLDESQPFPAIVISAAGVDAAVGSHGQPPPATTGDLFQGTLVTNSQRQAERSNIYYSLPSAPDYFPSPYFLDFETPDNDIVTNIKTLNNRLGVFLQTRLFRVNYLPTEADADFNRGICREEVSGQVGCVNAMCACLFEGQSGRSELAFVSNIGIHSTDLFSLVDLTSDLNWRDIMGAANSTPIALINDPENRELLFYYKNSTSGSEHYKCLHLNYDDSHIRNRKLKISGPVHMRNSAGGGVFGDLYSAWVAQRANGLTSVYLGYGGSAANATAAGAGQVYREHGNSIPALDSTVQLRTRRMYLSDSGVGGEFRVDKMFLYAQNGSGSQDHSVTPYSTLTNATAVATGTANTYTWAGQSVQMLDFPQITEGLEIGIAQTANNAGDIAFLMAIINFTDYGIEDSGL